jgi:hypothetical protein
MRIFLVLIYSFALACVAYGAQQEENKAQKKKQAKTAQQAAPPTRQPTGARAGSKKTSMGAYEGQKGKKGQTSMGAYEGQKGRKGQTSTGAYEGRKGKKGQTSMGAHEEQRGKPAEAATARTAGKKAAKGKPFKPQHFNLASKTKPNKAAAPAVNFQQNRRIQGSQNWKGANYTVFRTYTPVWHDRGWWNSHYNRVVFVFGGWYYWNAGWWYPAWGYAPGAYYAYDGPIYGYNNLPPDQVIANAQAALQQQGYYQGEVDGLLGPITRDAIANYQRDHGLYITSAIDRPTLESLGMTLEDIS